MSDKIIISHHLKESNGKTFRENNLEKKHSIPIGSLVGLENGVRLFVAQHRRDCDGTPLYTLSIENDPWHWENNPYCLHGGYEKNSIEVIE